MKSFFYDLLRTISVLCGFFGAILVMNGAIEKIYAFAIMFAGIFLFFIPFIEDTKPQEKKEDTNEKNIFNNNFER